MILETMETSLTLYLFKRILHLMSKFLSTLKWFVYNCPNHVNTSFIIDPLILLFNSIVIQRRVVRQIST